jgi:flavocytochrome c
MASDGVASASQVVGGSWSPPKGPSPEDEILVNEWKSKGKLHVLEGVWCAVPYKVTVVPSEDAAGDTKAQAQEILNKTFTEVESTFSHYVDTSEVSAINRLEADKVHKPSAKMAKVLSMAATINQKTRGAFDPAILPLSEFYKEKVPAGYVSEAGNIAKYSKWSMFKIDADGIKKTHSGAKMDLCGLAKGFAIDEISQQLKDAGFTASFVDWGGDIKVTGKHPAGRNWTAAILRPPALNAIGGASKGDDYLAHIQLRDGQSIVTSGDYMQTLGEGKSHIINPKNGEPCPISEDTCAQISLVAKSCMLADALATAAMVNGKVKAARSMLDMFRGPQLKDPVEDYLLFTREGPRVVRLVVPAGELSEHSTDRLARHDQATVVVVGGGLAGISAAIEAMKAKAKVILIEKEADLGGNSAKATSGINACGTRVQFSQGVEDDGRYFERDTHVSAKGGKSDIACVTTLSDKSAEAIHWLIDELGVELTALSQLGGHARKRTHRVPPRSDGTPVPVGYTIMQHARAAVQGCDDIKVLTKCTLNRLLKIDDDREVEGVEYTDADGKVQQIKCDAVVITTGGFGYDHSSGSLMQEHRPDLVGVPTTNGAFADGSGIRFGKSIGANLIDMDKVQLHPTAFIDPKDPGAHTKYLGPEALRGSGGILLDQQGRRFINELDLRSVVSNKILEHCDSYNMPDGSKYRPWAWCVLNEESQEKFGKPMLLFYKDQVGLFQQVEGTKGLADLIGCSESNVLETLKEYGKSCDDKICQKTGKVVFPSKVSETDSNFIVARITPCIHYCMGGLEISANAEVLTSTAEVKDDASKLAVEASKGAVGRRAKIKRLFAAGECTGGVHGGNRLGGNSLLECVVFGRLAGQRAATINQKVDGLLEAGEWVPVQLREVRATDAKYGHNTAVYRFNLHGALQHTGLEVGRFVSIKGELDGDTITGYYSPISRPDDEGIIDILCRTDDKGGPIVGFLLTLKPGSSCWLKGMGGPRLTPDPSSAAWMYAGNPSAKLRKFSLLAGGTGLAPALQIARAYFRHLTNHSEDDPNPSGGIRILYAADSAGDLAFMQAFDGLKARFPNLIDYYVVLNKPPPGWTMGVGFVDLDCLRQKVWYPPSPDHLCVMCGPPIFEKIMCGNLSKLGYPREQYYSFDADPDSGT